MMTAGYLHSESQSLVQSWYSPSHINNEKALIDLHSHLYESEVIGLLAGTLDDSTDTLMITHSRPGKSTSTSTTCEISSIDLVEAQEEFSKQGLEIVGWYHSHPTFDPIPSKRDCETQKSYQHMFRGKPFCGIICNPYPRSGGKQSGFEVFRVDPSLEDEWAQLINPAMIPFCIPAAVHKSHVEDHIAVEELMDASFAIIETSQESVHAAHVMNLNTTFRIRGVDEETGYRDRNLDESVEKRMHLIMSMHSQVVAHYTEKDTTLLMDLILKKIE